MLLTAPVWHNAASQFLALEQRTVQGPVHQDSSFMMEDVVFFQIKQGADDLLLRAKRLLGVGENKGFTLEGADAVRLGPKPAHITAGSAYYQPNQEILTMLDEVVVETAKIVVKTPAMRYLAKFETIKSAADVELVGQGFNITGTSFMYNLNSGDLRVGKRVTFHYTPPAPEETILKQ